MNEGNVQRPVANVNDLLDRQEIGAPAVVFLVLTALAMVADGFDISAMGYIAPELVKHWHVAPAALVPVLTAGIIGLLVGAPLLGWFGDRFGRKKAIVATLAVVGVFSIITMTATDLRAFTALRFVTGVGLGGLIPNVVALAAEVAPKRMRGVFIVIVSFGVPAGLALPGWVAALFVPTYGWQAILLVGGIMPLLIGSAVLLFVQESIRYLIQRGDREDEVRRRLVAMFGAKVDLPPTTASISAPQPALRLSGSPNVLFTEGLALVTPVLWLTLAANQFTNFFVVSWLPTLLQASGASTASAGINASLFSLGGLVGGVVIMLTIDRFGAVPLVILFLLGAPAVAAIGFAHVPPAYIGAVIAGAGFCVTGNNFGLNAVLGLAYPTPLRSKGTGWAQAAGRAGAVVGQVVGGALLARHLSLHEVFLAPACALIIGAGASGVLVRLCLRRYGGYRLDDTLLIHSTPAVTAAPSTQTV